MDTHYVAAAMARLEQRLDAQARTVSELQTRIDDKDRAIASMTTRLSRLEGLESLLRDIEVDVAAIITELRASVLPKLLRGKRAHVGHRTDGPRLSPETVHETRKRTAAIARASKQVGRGSGAVRDPATRHRLRTQAGA